jgi:hypothetical protein
MPSSGILRRVALVRTNVSEERIASIIKVTRNLRSVFRLLVTANIVPSSQILVVLMMEAISSSEILVLKRAARHHIPEDGILQKVHSSLADNAYHI